MTIVPFPEYRPDITSFQGSSTRFVQNAVPQADGYAPFKSLSAVSASLGATCRGYFCGRKKDGSVLIFAATSTKLFRLDNTDFTWDDVSAGGGSYSALTNSAQWQFAQFGDLIIAVQQAVVPQSYNLTSSSEFAALAGSPPQAAYIAVLNRFVFLSGLFVYDYLFLLAGLLFV